MAILCSDLHFSHKAPIARSVESNWYTTQKRYLDQLQNLAEKHNAPIVCAGDIFDKWNAPVELVNFLLTNIKQPIYAVPGQHDLPYHSKECYEKSAYRTLELAGKIINIEVEFPAIHKDLRMWAFRWGQKVVPCQEKHGLFLELAVVHQYLWIGKHCYPDAPGSQKVTRNLSRFKGYHCAIVGDNHKRFLYKTEDFQLLNCGTFMRRKIDEINYKPKVGLLYSDHTIKKHKLDTKEDKFLLQEDIKKLLPENSMAFLEELQSLSDTGISFKEVMVQTMKKLKVSENVRRIILEVMEE